MSRPIEMSVINYCPHEEPWTISTERRARPAPATLDEWWVSVSAWMSDECRCQHVGWLMSVGVSLGLSTRRYRRILLGYVLLSAQANTRIMSSITCHLHQSESDEARGGTDYVDVMRTNRLPAVDGSCVNDGVWRVTLGALAGVDYIRADLWFIWDGVLVHGWFYGCDPVERCMSFWFCFSWAL